MGKEISADFYAGNAIVKQGGAIEMKLLSKKITSAPTADETKNFDVAELKSGVFAREDFDDVYRKFIQDDIALAQRHLDELPEKDRRGLTPETLRHFGCGFIPNWILTKSRAEFACGMYLNDVTGEQKHLPPPSPRIIVPTADYLHFNAIATPTARRTMDKRFHKQHAGQKALFGDVNALDADTIFVVEGEVDAMSIWQASQGKIAVIAILGCDNWKSTILPIISKLYTKKLILLLDADAAGNKAADKLYKSILAAGVVCVNKKINDFLTAADRKYFGSKVDPNMILADRNHGGDFLNRLLTEIADSARADFPAVADKIAAMKNNPFGTGTEPVVPTSTSKSLPNTAEPARLPDVKVDDDKLTAEITRMLAIIPAKKLSREDWINVGMVIKLYGFEFEDFDEWSRDDSRYDANVCKTQWNSFKTADEIGEGGVKIGTLIRIAKQFGYTPPPDGDVSAQNKLAQANRQRAEFDAEKKAAIETLRNQQSFDKNAVFTPEVLDALSYAKLFAPDEFNLFLAEIKNCNDNADRPNKTNVATLLNEVRERSKQLALRDSDIKSDIREYASIISTEKFFDAFKELSWIEIPDGYKVTEKGVEAYHREGYEDVCRRPVIVTGQIYNADTGVFFRELAYFTSGKRWRKLPPVDASVTTDKRKIVQLSDYGLPVTSNNAARLIQYIDDFVGKNETRIPSYYTTEKCGWQKIRDEVYFIDPRRKNVIDDGGRQRPVLVDSQNELAKSLSQKGSLSEWAKAYKLAKTSLLARLLVAAALSTPLLAVVDERNFTIYLYGKSRLGKTKAIEIGASAVGEVDSLLRSFDSTENALVETAYNAGDYGLFVDERQSADSKANLTRIAYLLNNGISRGRLTDKIKLRKTRTWKLISMMTGEAELFEDNTTEGARTRTLSIRAKEPILTAETVKKIIPIIAKNYGLAFPRVVDKIIEYRDQIPTWFNSLTNAFSLKFPDRINDYCRYLAILSLGDALLNVVLGENLSDALRDAQTFAMKILDKYIEDAAEIDDVRREIDFVKNFIAENQAAFLRERYPSNDGNQQTPTPKILGKFADNGIYITVTGLKDACAKNGFYHKKLVADLTEYGFFVPEPGGRRKSVAVWLNKISCRCYQIPKCMLKTQVDNPFDTPDNETVTAPQTTLAPQMTITTPIKLPGYDEAEPFDFAEHYDEDNYSDEDFDISQFN